ncbi:MAG: ABC transporter permease [Anaerolineae bacterium]|nr:ABC transporter permease [Anaerolineae bacterium]
MSRLDSTGCALALLIVGATFLGWELGVQFFQAPVYILPAPSRILATLSANASVYALATLITLGEAVVGLLLGILGGVILVSLISLWPGLEQGVMIVAILVKSTPLVAIAPLLTIWLGFGVLPKVVLVAVLTFFPVLVNMLSGIQATEPALLEVFRSWHASQRELFRHVRVPYALPYVFAALKVSGPLALVGAVVAEWTGASGGLGRLMWLAYTNLNLPQLFAAVFILALAGISLYALMVYTERRIVFWQHR